MPRPVYVKTEVAAERAVTDILIRKQPVVAIKCLGCNVGEKGGRITLVSVGCWDGHVYVFDVKKCPAIVYAGGLLRLLQAAQFLKVFHNCTPDCTTLMKQFGVRVNHFYDTQIAHAVIMERNGLPARRLSLRQICDSYKQSAPAVPPELERLVCEDVNVWARRPVTHAMLDLAAASVRPLVPGLFVNTDR
ncbi:EXD1-like protein [Mya arenaria]|uniref:EXD1-like protein n=2 Tax=Mya arenaria TaxID=6604 RepID=A0ABY7DTH9_MYAAR|nr:EXD1-like protein [Mya arenaria]